MLIKVNNKVYHLSSENKIGICFQNDIEKEEFINILKDMPPKDGIRWFVSFPINDKKNAKDWIKLSKKDINNSISLIAKRTEIIHNK